MMKNDIGVLGQVLTQQVLAQIEQDLTEVEANNPYKRQAKIIRFLREMKRLDQKQLGQLLGVDHSTVSRYERLGCNDSPFAHLKSGKQKFIPQKLAMIRLRALPCPLVRD